MAFLSLGLNLICCISWRHTRPANVYDHSSDTCFFQLLVVQSNIVKCEWDFFFFCLFVCFVLCILFLTGMVVLV